MCYETRNFSYLIGANAIALELLNPHIHHFIVNNRNSIY